MNRSDAGPTTGRCTHSVPPPENIAKHSMDFEVPFLADRIPHLPRRIVGVGMVLVLFAWLPRPLIEFEFAVLQAIALLFIGIGLYELFSSGLVNIFRSAFLITLGVGIQLLVLDIISFAEWLTYWPMALITFGIVVLLADAIEARKYQRYRHAHR